ncbi:MAG: DNA topoisomerase 4 subunit A [Lachnospiraceae bacterium]|nr:DNA topoisomerase 4 subunit A [Lachnospiraceae bacterium]
MAETILTTEYSTEMQKSFINYSMSVITARAVPDIRDGLKPVQRRVLYAMNELGLNSDKPHRKSARIVGDAMGKYHPHGDSSIYEALVVLSQDFKKGMALVDGHGNFGSIEGDGAAAMRYTEARLKKFTQEVYLADLDKNVVDFVPNFDETEKEPEVLPVRVPNFLINGSDGIAVGMTTSTPPHNLVEIIDAMELLMDKPEVTTAELLEVVQGPDFPTGGVVTNKDDLLEIYETGRGKIKIRGKAEVVPGKRKTDKDCIVISEIPYTMIGANIGKFLSDVVSLAESKKLPDIIDVSNQSSKEGIKIVIELRKGADGEQTLQGILKKTKLEDTFGVNMLAIVDGRPEVLGLKAILEHNLNFQIEVNTRKYTTLLEKERSRKEIQEGLIRAVDVIDLIIEIIRGSKTLKMAKTCLVEGVTEGIQFKTEKSRKQASQLKFTENQATAILELRLSKLIGLEILALQDDYKKTLEKIALYEKILGSRKAMLKAIRKDLDSIKKNYGIPRRTEIANLKEAVFVEAPAQVLDVTFLMNRFGYAKVVEQSVFEKNEAQLREENTVFINCRSDEKLCIFTREGNMHQLKLADVPMGRPKDKGVPIDNICKYDSAKENILQIFCWEQIRTKCFVFATAMGAVKQVAALEFDTVKRTIAATKLADGDEVIAIEPADKPYIVMTTDEKHALRFRVSEIPSQRKNAVGVRAFKLTEGERMNGVWLLDEKEKQFSEVTKKKTDLNGLPLKKRDGKPELLA